MPEINNVNSALSDLSIRHVQEEAPKENELGQSAFLKLMVTQLKNQSPLSPQDNSQFVAQLAQFSSVESLDKLNNNFNTFTSSFVANQALQASTLVGRSVTVPAEATRLDAGGVIGVSVDVPATTGDVSIKIYAENGTLVESISLGEQQAGELVMRWDGMSMEVNGDLLDWETEHENGLPSGTYRFEVTSSINGSPTELATSLSANVNSVTIGANGALVLNLAGIGPVNMSDVKQFNE